METNANNNPISFAELAELEATVKVYHRERFICNITIRPELITPTFRSNLLNKVAEQDVDGNTEMILAAAVSWDFKLEPNSPAVAPLTAEFLRGLSFGMRNSIAMAINMEAVNPQSASA